MKEVKFISLDEENRKLMAARLQAERKYQKNTNLIYEKGKLEGKLEGVLETALDFLDFGMELEKVCQITGLTEKQILDYRRNKRKK
jgi:predicted transposase/invertase (TIGR01784 family)